MTTTIREERVQELAESNYLMLRDTYHLVRELKGMVDRLHDVGLQGGSTHFDQLGVIKLTMDRLYGDLERYLRPELDPDSAHPAALTEDTQ
jgi:IS4 transposase